MYITILPNVERCDFQFTLLPGQQILVTTIYMQIGRRPGMSEKNLHASGKIQTHALAKHIGA